MFKIKDKKTGKFVQKSEQKRKIRSIRLTDKTYQYLNLIAKKNNQSIADLIEYIAESKLLEKLENNSLTKKEKNTKSIITKQLKIPFESHDTK